MFNNQNSKKTKLANNQSHRHTIHIIINSFTSLSTRTNKFVIFGYWQFSFSLTKITQVEWIASHLPPPVYLSSTGRSTVTFRPWSHHRHHQHLRYQHCVCTDHAKAQTRHLFTLSSWSPYAIQVRLLSCLLASHTCRGSAKFSKHQSCWCSAKFHDVPYHCDLALCITALATSSGKHQASST